MNNEAILNSVSPLERRHKDALLDLVLEWAKIDGALGWFLATIHGFTPVEGAALIEGMKAAQIFQDARKAIRKYPGGDEAAAKLKKMKAAYESYAPIRNRIAYSCCAGVDYRDSERVIFLVFSAEGTGLAAEAVSLNDIINAAGYARSLNSYLFEVSDRISKSE